MLSRCLLAQRVRYDDSFSSSKVAGEGVTVAALRRVGVFSEEELHAAETAL